jgi:hypothetical protein
MKHAVIDIETPNEPSNYDFPILDNYNFDSYFENFVAEISPIPENELQENVFEEPHFDLLIVNTVNNIEDIKK